MQFQASVFDSIPYEWQARELPKNIDSFSLYKKEFDSMLIEYKDQHLSRMENLLSKSELGSDKKYEDILLNKRKNLSRSRKKIKKKVFLLR